MTYSVKDVSRWLYDLRADGEEFFEQYAIVNEKGEHVHYTLWREAAERVAAEFNKHGGSYDPETASSD